MSPYQLTFNGITAISRDFWISGLNFSLIFSENSIINILRGTPICGAAKPTDS